MSSELSNKYFPRHLLFFPETNALPKYFPSLLNAAFGIEVERPGNKTLIVQPRRALTVTQSVPTTTTSRAATTASASVSQTPASNSVPSVAERHALFAQALQGRNPVQQAPARLQALVLHMSKVPKSGRAIGRVVSSGNVQLPRNSSDQSYRAPNIFGRVVVTEPQRTVQRTVQLQCEPLYSVAGSSGATDADRRAAHMQEYRAEMAKLSQIYPTAHSSPFQSGYQQERCSLLSTPQPGTSGIPRPVSSNQVSSSSVHHDGQDRRVVIRRTPSPSSNLPFQVEPDSDVEIEMVDMEVSDFTGHLLEKGAAKLKKYGMSGLDSFCKMGAKTYLGVLEPMVGSRWAELQQRQQQQQQRSPPPEKEDQADRERFYEERQLDRETIDTINSLYELSRAPSSSRTTVEERASETATRARQASHARSSSSSEAVSPVRDRSGERQTHAVPTQRNVRSTTRAQRIPTSQGKGKAGGRGGKAKRTPRSGN